MGRKRQLPLISGISWKGRPGKAAMVLYKDRYSCLYCENIQGKQLECGGIFKGKYFSFRYPGKRISRRSEFSSYGRKWCMRGNLEEGNSMYLGETLEIEDSWKNDHKSG